MEPRKTALLTLGYRFLRATSPPSLRTLGAWLTVGEPYAVFKDLVRQYLSDKEAEILALPHASMAGAFSRAFSERYFPLLQVALGGELPLERLVCGIPVEVYGLQYDDYHELPQNRPGMAVAALFVDFEEYVEEGGIRVALLDVCRRWLPEALLKKLRKGFDPGFLEFALEDKPEWRGLLHWAFKLINEVGLFFFATCMGDLYGNSCHSTGPPEWDPDVVANLTSDWEECSRMLEEEKSFYTWLEEDLAARAQELITYLEEKCKDWQKLNKPKT